MEESEATGFRDSLTTVDKKGKRIWVFPRKPKGSLHRWRVIASIIQLGILFGIPFIKVDGHPWILLNILERKFILFGVTIWPQDFYLVVLLFIASVVFIILFTVIFGRVFCGWVCPQTIFMEMVFRKIEYLIEGDYNKQKRLDKQEWNTEKIIKKGTKHVIFFGIAILVSNTLLAYIVGIDELFKIISEPVSQHVGGFVALLIFSGIFYWIFAWFREQVCTIACPYGRLQGVMLDKDSIVVAYDYKRGEPRKKLHKGKERSAGDCIDCHQCVQVCPTGIDIRNGTQLECVNCTACIDACNNIMEKINKPKGLIRYDSENGIANGDKLRLSPRIVGYSIVLIGLLVTLTSMLALRSDVKMILTKSSGSLYTVTDNNNVRNIYKLKLLNKTNKEYSLELKTIPEDLGFVSVVGKNIKVLGQKSVDGTIIIDIPRNKLSRTSNSIEIGIYNNGELVTSEEVRFLGPPKY